jgi:hypothetical protein
MVSRVALLLLPLLAFGQNQQNGHAPPADVDQALRARATEFLQFHVDGNFRKAMNLVAEDTQDYYFAANKIRLVDFKITDIAYNDDYTKAEVTAIITRMWRIHVEEEKVVVPMVTAWKIEDGKWVWYYDEKSKRRFLSMGESDPEAIRKMPPVGQMPDLSPEAMQKSADKILTQSKVDRTEVTFAVDKKSVEMVTFHNGFPGAVMLTAYIVRPVPGFTAELKKASLGKGEDAVLVLHYTPTAEAAKGTTQVDLRLQPFDEVFSVAVAFTADGKAAPRK